MISRFVAVAATVLCLRVATVAAADPQTPVPAPTPTPVNLPTLPPSTSVNPYVKAAIDLVTGVVRSQLASNANSANGQVTYFKRFEMQVRTGENRYRAIHLHQGTTINPLGQSLQSGQHVNVAGVNQPDGSLNADSITILQ
jgi:hypothetical protein